MKRRSLIFLCIMFGIVLFIILLNSTVFCVQKTSINFLSTKIKVTDSEEDILKNCIDEKAFGSIFFVNKTKIKRQIQTKYPYIRVINVESIFPNELKIHIVEREEFYAVKTKDCFYICDNELGIIKKVNAFSSTQSNPIVLENIKINSEQEIGLSLNTEKINFVTKFSNCLNEWETNLVILQGNILGVNIDYIKENQILISMFDGVSILIENADKNMNNKLNCAFSYYDKNNLKGGIIKIIDAFDGYSKLIYEK